MNSHLPISRYLIASVVAKRSQCRIQIEASPRYRRRHGQPFSNWNIKIILRIFSIPCRMRGIVSNKIIKIVKKCSRRRWTVGIFKRGKTVRSIFFSDNWSRLCVEYIFCWSPFDFDRSTKLFHHIKPLRGMGTCGFCGTELINCVAKI